MKWAKLGAKQAQRVADRPKPMAGRPLIVAEIPTPRGRLHGDSWSADHVLAAWPGKCPSPGFHFSQDTI
jgi:hypothetical protein